MDTGKLLAAIDESNIHAGFHEKYMKLTFLIKNLCKQENEPPEWNGTGLPPVGCACEWRACPEDDFAPVTVIGRYKNITWILWALDEDDNPSTLVSHNSQPANFRPIRTEAEKQREADINEITKIASQANFKTERELAVLLVDAGFTRKPDEQKPQ